MKVGIHEAKTKLSKLIPAALAGEEVVIAKSGRPLVKLVPVEKPSGPRQLGAYADKITIKADLMEPLPESIVNEFWLETGNE